MKADIGRPLSLSLPFNLQNLPLKGQKVANYFDNLLPDSDAIRRRVAERFSPGLQRPLPKVQAELPQDFSAHVRDAILGGLEQAARECSVRCRHKQAKSRMFQGQFARARIYPD